MKILQKVVLIVMIGSLALFVFSLFRLQNLKSERLRLTEIKVEIVLSELVPLAELYTNANSDYAGFCKSKETMKVLQEASDSAAYYTVKNDYVCNDSSIAWAATVPLSSGTYSCVDSVHLNQNSKPIVTLNPLQKNTTCVL